jgi:hypothetical protein
MRALMRMCTLSCVAVLTIGTAVHAGTPAADSYSLTWMGLTSADFLSASGTTLAESIAISENGYVAGRNQIYYGGTSDFGDAFWVYDGVTTERVGLFDAAHTRSSDGYQNTAIIGFLDEGPDTFLMGDSRQYFGTSQVGSTPWLWDGTQTIKLGLTGAEYTHADGYVVSGRWEFGSNGNTAGTTTIYNGTATSVGLAGWVYNYAADTTTRVGLTGAQYVRSDGFAQTKIGRVSQGGDYVFGRTYRYDGSTNMGTHGWRYDVATDTTVQIGLTGPENVRADGYMEVEIRRGNEAGQLNGLSRKYDGSTDMGRTAWLFDGTTTIAISPTEPQFTRADGYSDSDAWYINASGQVAGEATTYDGSSTAGKSAWFYDGTTTRVLPGLLGGVFEKSNGFTDALSTGLNSSGQVLGVNTRYNESDGYLGRQGWLYDSATDVTIALEGLTDPAYTRDSDGKEYHYPAGLSETGLVLGKSDRYDGLFSSGYWVYDWDTNATYELAFSTRSDGYYNTPKREFTSDGDGVVGYYELFDEFDASVGFSLYYWTIDRATDTAIWYDLEDRTTLAAMEDLYYLYYLGCGMNGDGWIVGTGTQADGSQGAYLLTPASTGRLGDFDGDGDIDADDIDALGAAIAAGGADPGTYDMDGDGDVDSDDFAFHVHNLVDTALGQGTGTAFGDFNLDGMVGILDLGLLGDGYNQSLGWANGDANGDGIVGILDLGHLGDNYGYDGSAIPEPVTMSVLGIGSVVLLKRRK